MKNRLRMIAEGHASMRAMVRAPIEEFFALEPDKHGKACHKFAVDLSDVAACVLIRLPNRFGWEQARTLCRTACEEMGCHIVVGKRGVLVAGLRRKAHGIREAIAHAKTLRSPLRARA